MKITKNRFDGSFAATLKSMLESRNVDLETFHFQSGVPRKTIRKWLKGERVPRAGRMRQVWSLMGWPTATEESWRDGIQRDIQLAVKKFYSCQKGCVPDLAAALARIGHTVHQFFLEMGIPASLHQDENGVSKIDVLFPGKPAYGLAIVPRKEEDRYLPEVVLTRRGARAVAFVLRPTPAAVSRIIKIAKEITRE